MSIHIEDFDDFHAEEDMHIVISVKDFRAIVTHAETLRTPISVHFSRPSRPLQFSYQKSGLHCAFTLMTTGDYRGVTPSAPPRPVSTRPVSRQTSNAPTQTTAGPNTDMPPPSKPSSALPQAQRKPLSALNRGTSLVTPSQASDSLFVPNDMDDERRWQEPNYDNEENEDLLGWDASGEMHSAVQPTLRDAGSHMPPSRSVSNNDVDSQGLGPTQRLSQLNGLFD